MTNPARIPNAELARAVEEVFDLRPGAFHRYLDLHRPIYRPPAAYGHLRREEDDLTWRTDRTEELRRAAGLEAEALA